MGECAITAVATGPPFSSWPLLFSFLPPVPFLSERKKDSTGHPPCSAVLAACRAQIAMEYCGAGSLCDLMAICEKTLTEEHIAAVMKMSLYGQ